MFASTSVSASLRDADSRYEGATLGVTESTNVKYK